MTAPRARARCRLVVTGDEVLLGRVSERNAAFLASELDALGVTIEETRIISDEPEGITRAVAEAIATGCELVITSGGLGPTHDDRTMAAVAAATGRPMRLDPAALEIVRAAHSTRVRAGVEESARKQAELPDGAVVLPPMGTAPGAIVPVGSSMVVVLPGPPWELMGMWADAITREPLRSLLASSRGRARRVVRLFAVPESELMAVRAGLDAGAADALHGIYTAPGELELVIDEEAGDAAALMIGLRAAFGDRLYTEDGRRVDEIVATTLLERGETLAVAESCTGGGLGARLTAMPGSSAWFRGGVISYDNAVKAQVLGVTEPTLERHGAVSVECAREMATGVRSLIDAHWSVAITGIAGPGGGTPDKPVGLVVIAVAGPRGAEAWEHRLPGDRDGIRLRAGAFALHRLRVALS